MSYSELFAQLVRTEIALWNALDAHVRAEAGITLPQQQALTAVDTFAGTSRVQDISGEMSITVGATSKLVDRLERDGLAARESNPDDRRSSIVVLTAAGLASLEAAKLASESFLQKHLEGSLSTERIVELTAELASLRSGLPVGSGS